MLTSPRFEAVPFPALPGWANDDHAAAFNAFLSSCMVVGGGRHATGTEGHAASLRAHCNDALKLNGSAITSTAARAFFESRFTPHAVIHAGPPGLLTGYYEPTLAGSRVRSAAFQTPVYRRPPELVNLVDESQRGTRGEALTHGRRSGTGIVPFATRAEIEQGALAGRGLELVYLAHPVDVFFMHVQGSGRVNLPDGSYLRLTYDGKNGHPYTSIGRYLIDGGHFTAASMSLAALSDWLKADDARARTVMWQNNSYVFFRELAAEEAKGALGVLDIPLSPGRSLAIDAGIHSIGLPIYVHAPTLTHAGDAHGFSRLMVAQDVGSAINGPERGDIYFGAGAEAGRLAGVTKHEGRLFALLPNAHNGQRPAAFEDTPLGTSSLRATAAPAGREP